jgi:hypothetical protein
LTWIPKYVFNNQVIFRDTDIPNDNFSESIQTKKILLVADSNLLERLTSTLQDESDKRITKLYYNSSETIATFIDKESSRHRFMNILLNFGFGEFTEVRGNY